MLDDIRDVSMWIVSILVIILLLLGSFILGLLYGLSGPDENIPDSVNISDILNNPREQYIHTEQYIVNLCSNKTLSDTAECLHGEMLKFYWVNMTAYGQGLPYNESFQNIIDNGGVCLNYNRLYMRLADQLQFSSTDVNIFLTGYGHYFIIIYDDSGYCVMDQISRPACKDFGLDMPINKSLYLENQIYNKTMWSPFNE